MKALATLYREAQLYTHAAHNLVSGPTFFQDHKFLGELYGTYEDGYDGLIERSIGLGEPLDPLEITDAAAASAADKKLGDAKKMFSQILQFEQDLCDEINSYLSKGGVSHGVSNLLEGLADESEARQYKIGQRVK